ncbi:MAG: hypothetical protein ACJ71Z_06930 [Aeromicrobium sp.]
MSMTLALLLILAVVVVFLLVNASSRGPVVGRGGPTAGTTRVVERDVADPTPGRTERVVERPARTERVVEREVVEDDDPFAL